MCASEKRLVSIMNLGLFSGLFLCAICEGSFLRNVYKADGVTVSFPTDQHPYVPTDNRHLVDLQINSINEIS